MALDVARLEDVVAAVGVVVEVADTSRSLQNIYLQNITHPLIMHNVSTKYTKCFSFFLRLAKVADFCNPFRQR